MAKSNKVWKGPVIGVNIQGFQSPVFYDLHTAINGTSTGSSTAGVLITGAPGSGKSFSGMTLAMMSAVCGKKTIFLDPKNDARGMAVLGDSWLDGKVTIVDINDKTLKGAMDPFVAGLTKKDRVTKAWNLLSIILGPFTDDQRITFFPIIQDVAELPNASMRILQTKLDRHSNPVMNSLGTKLQAIRGSAVASNIIFADTDDNQEPTKSISLNDGLTIISMMGLSLPSPGAPSDTYTDKEKLSVGVMWLITEFLTEAMQDEATKDDPKSIFIDEAWAVTSTQIGYNTVGKLIRLGRSMNTAVVLMTQNASDIRDYSSNGSGGDESRLNSQIATRFAFNCGDSEEGRKLCDAMGLSYEFVDEFLNLQRGCCVMKDYKGRMAKMQFNTPNEEWARAFETNPSKRAQAKLRVAEEAAQHEQQ